MKEIKNIIAAYDKALLNQQQVVLATVVHTEGSSYRGAGARMLVTQEGNLTGAISGGCLEGDALRKALLAIKEKKTMLVTYDTNDEDDAIFGLGLGCNGIIQVLIEPVDPSDPFNAVELLREIARERQPAILITLFSLADKKSPQPGTVLLLKGNKSLPPGSAWKELLLPHAESAWVHKRSSFRSIDNNASPGNKLTAFIEYIQPAISLVVIGAGNDVVPLTEMASILGWDITVVDGRANYAKPDRFPSCQVLVSKPAEVLDQVSIDNRTVFALMTHNYNYDQAILKELLTREVVYIGLLGPKKKRDRMLDEIRNAGVLINEQQLSILHGPIGLDIGAETSEEIALSIVAEISAVISGKEGNPLKYGNETIHARNAD